MAQSPGQRNKKLAAKAAKRKEQVADQKAAERLSASLGARVQAAAAGPIVCCLRTRSMMDAGIGHVVLARQLPSGLIGCAFFLVDLLCLGVKDVYFREITPSKLDEYIETSQTDGEATVDADPAFARKIVTGAVAFAAGSGLPPAKNYDKIVRIFGDIAASSSTETVEFGRDGEPFFIPGAKDSLAYERRVIAALTRTRGPRGFDLGLPEEARARLSFLGQAPTATDGPAATQGNGPVIDHEGSTDVAEPDRPEPDMTAPGPAEDAAPGSPGAP